MRILTILIMFVAIAESTPLLFYSKNMASGQEPTNKSSNKIVLSPIYAPDNNIEELFEKEFVEMVKRTYYEDPVD